MESREHTVTGLLVGGAEHHASATPGAVDTEAEANNMTEEMRMLEEAIKAYRDGVETGTAAFNYMLYVECDGDVLKLVENMRGLLVEVA